MRVRQLKNGEYDMHLDFYDAHILKTLLKQFIDKCDFKPCRQVDMYKALDEVIKYPAEEKKLKELKQSYTRDYIATFIDEDSIKDFEAINMDNSHTEIIVPLEMRQSEQGILVYTETKVYPVLSNSPAVLYLWNFHNDGACKVSINEDGYIYLAEKNGE